MKIFIISLQKSQDRREHIKELLKPLNLDWQFFDAINGFDSNFPFKGMQADLYRTIFRSRPLSAGEKGCYASHFLLWKKCIELNENIVILEDDIQLSAFFTYILKILPELHSRYPLIRLEPANNNSPCKLVESDGSVQIIKLLNNSSGTLGYSITPEAAKQLICNSQKWTCAVDNFIGEEYKHKVSSFGVIPYAVFDPELFNQSGFKSTIQLDSKTKVFIGFKLLREISRFYRFIRRML